MVFLSRSSPSGKMICSGVRTIICLISSRRATSSVSFSSLPPSVLDSDATDLDEAASSMSCCFGFRCLRQKDPTSCGVHQKTGNCRWMLLTRHATPNMSVLPSIMNGTNIQPILMVVGSTAARTAVAPPGGCTVLVMDMAKEATAHAVGPAIHRRLSMSDESSNSLAIATPVIAERPWPTIAARGWARGDCMVL